MHPDEQQAVILSKWIGCQRFIYNAKVGEDRYFRTFARKSLSLAGVRPPVDQKYSHFATEETAFLREVPSQILRNGAYRWMTGYQRFFKKLGSRPKFHGKTGRQTVLITSELYTIDTGKGIVSLGTKSCPVGDIPYTLHGEKNLSAPKTITIARHAGRWWLSFNYAEDISPGEEPRTEAELIQLFKSMTEEELMDLTSGNDRGVAIPVACSSGENYDFDPVVKARLQKTEKNRKHYQRQMERQQDGSKRKEKTKRKVDKTYEYQADCRNDFAHKTSRKLVDSKAILFSYEDLKIANMTKKPKAKQDENGRWLKNGYRAKAGLNRVILGSAWGSLLAFTRYKALRKNKITIKVKPNGTSQECSRCGHIHPDNRETQSLFVCKSCGLSTNADYNASLNIKRRGVKLLLSEEYGPKAKKTVRFRKTAVTRDGTPEVKRVLEKVASGSPYGISDAGKTGDSRKPCMGSPIHAGVCEPRNPHYNNADKLAA